MVGGQFNSENSILQFNMEKVGSKAADILQLPLSYIHPYKNIYCKGSSISVCAYVCACIKYVCRSSQDFARCTCY